MVNCDACWKDFAPELKVTKRNGERGWFRCPHCNHRYEVYQLTNAGIGLRAKLKDAQKAYSARPNAVTGAAMRRAEEAFKAEYTKL